MPAEARDGLWYGGQALALLGLVLLLWGTASRLRNGGGVQSAGTGPSWWGKLRYH